MTAKESKMNNNHYVDPTALINTNFRFLQGCNPVTGKKKNTRLPPKIFIGPFTSIGHSCSIGNGVVIDAYCSIDPYVTVGENTLLIYKASVGGHTTIGKDCIIGGFIPENCTIGDNCRIFGNLVHTHNDTTMSWDYHEVPEPSVVIQNNSFVGFNAVIIGGFSIGPNAYICSGAIITREVPPYHIASGTNNIIHYSEWKGNLKDNPIFK